MDEKLVAPIFDRLLGCFDQGWKNASAITRPIQDALEPLFDTLADLEPLENNSNVKSIWLRIPRGEISDFESYEDLLSFGEVSSREEYTALWNLEYPDDWSWYELVVSDEGDYRGVSVGRVFVISAKLDVKPAEFDWLEDQTIALLDLLTRAAEESMHLLHLNKYNSMIEESLPYWNRFGVVRRRDLWEANPMGKEALFEGMPNDVYREFRANVSSGAEDESSIGRLRIMTGDDFLNACSLGYEACGYNLCNEDGALMPPVDLYLRYADGRDEGLTGKGAGLHSLSGINLSSAKEWNDWYFDRDRHGGHPWEVCRGGNSTHVSLYVRHDRPSAEFRFRLGEMSEEQFREASENWGFYYCVSGNAWNRAVESVCFYIALKRADLPVIIDDAEAILSRFEGTDYVGIVPHDVFPAYCESMFPDRYGKMLDFIHVYDEDMDGFGQCIEWLPIRQARLEEDSQP